MSNNPNYEWLDEILNNHAQEFKAGHLDKISQAIISHIEQVEVEAEQRGLSFCKGFCLNDEVDTTELLTHIAIRERQLTTPNQPKREEQ